MTPDDQYEFLRHSIGLLNTPAVCQRIPPRILAPLKGMINVQASIDDYIIASADEETALQELEIFLKHLREVGLTLGLGKCTFLVTQIDI